MLGGADAVNCLSFNQDHGCFVCGTNSGFQVFEVEPLRLLHKRVLQTPVKHVQILHKSDLYAFVGTGDNPAFPPNKLVIWDDAHTRVLAELAFKQAVLGIELRRDRIVISTSRKLYVYRLADLSAEVAVHTYEEPRAVFAVSLDAPRAFGDPPLVLAYPLPAKGALEILKLPPISSIASGLCRTNSLMRHHASMSRTSSMNAVRGSTFKGTGNLVIQAHQSEITTMSLSSDGTRLATSSEKGTIIRVFETETGSQLQELRRGTERAILCSLAFSLDCSLLAITSDKSTVHVFTIEADTKRDRAMTDTFGLRPVSMETFDAPADLSPTLSIHNSSISDDPSPSTTRASSRFGSQASARALGASLQKIGNLVPSKTVQDYFDAQLSFAKIRDIPGESCCAFLHGANLLAIISPDRTFRLCLMGVNPHLAQTYEGTQNPNVPARADGDCTVLVRSTF